MTNAIIRHLNSGEHYRAELDDAGNCVRLSPAIDFDPGTTDPAAFEDVELTSWDDADDARHWTADRIAVVHTF